MAVRFGISYKVNLMDVYNVYNPVGHERYNEHTFPCYRMIQYRQCIMLDWHCLYYYTDYIIICWAI